MRLKGSDSKLSLPLARLVGGGFMLIGSLIAIAGLIWLIKTATFVKRATKADGTVIKMERGETSKGGSVYYPIFTFTDSSGIVHTQKTSSGSSSYSFEPGEKVKVLYDSAAPKHSEIDTFQTVWLFPLFLTGFGLLFGGFAFFWLFLATRAIKLGKEKMSRNDY